MVATFIASWNGTTMMAALNLPTEPDAVLWFDVSESWGCGAYSGVQWFQCKWTDTWQPFAVAVKELLPIAIACGLWGHLWKHKTILAKCDNVGVVQILPSRTTSKDPVIMHFRCIQFFIAIFQFRLRAEHVAGVLNNGADAIIS